MGGEINFERLDQIRLNVRISATWSLVYFE